MENCRMPRTFYFYLFLPPNPLPFNLGEQLPTQPQRGQSHRAQSYSCCSHKTPRHQNFENLPYFFKNKSIFKKNLIPHLLIFLLLNYLHHILQEYLAMCYIKYSGSMLDMLLTETCYSLVVFILVLKKIFNPY